MKEAKVHLKIGRSLESIPLVGVAVNAIAAYCGLDELTSTQIELAVIEAVNNGIEHSPDEDSQLEVIVERLPGRLSFHVVDGGEPCPGELKSSLPESPFAEGGYGLFLINEIADHAEWTNWNGRNCLHFWKHLEEKDSV